MLKNKIKSKYGQITIFVIIAIVLVAAVGFIFLISRPSVSPGISPRTDPEGYIRNCISSSVSNAEGLLIPNGGFVNPTGNGFTNFNGSKIAWMCYTSSSEQLCTNNHPMLRVEIEKEIFNYIKPEIDRCFSDVKSELSSYDYSDKPIENFSVNIVPSGVKVVLEKEISYTKAGEKVTIDNFNTQINSPLFEFVLLTLKIVTQELNCNCGSESCDADLLRLNRDNRNFEITKPDYETNGREIYRIQETLSGKQFNLAIRNCVRSVNV